MSGSAAILHITPHLGGGVGSVLGAWMARLPPGERHTILCLDRNRNPDWRAWPGRSPGQLEITEGLFFSPDYRERVRSAVAGADVVVLHWWNHPLTCELMLNHAWPACRLILWNHVSALFPPYVLPRKVFDFADHFVHTSAISRKVTDTFRGSATTCETIWSTVDISAYSRLGRKAHRGCIVGYTGTVDKGKMHPAYLRMSAAASGVRFLVCSGDSQIALQAEAARLGVEGAFTFLGRVKSVADYLPLFDIFGYPLQPGHFGSCEQSLGEAMMAGCVPVVMDNPTEAHIVRHGVDGLVARSEREYSEHLTLLAGDEGLRRRLAANARARALELYDLGRTVGRWGELLRAALDWTPRERSYAAGGACGPAELYAHSLGDAGAPLWRALGAAGTSCAGAADAEIRGLFATNPMFASQNKASPRQYLQFFPDDTLLRHWAELAQR